MHILKLHNNRRKVAISILAVFSFVFICDFLCDHEIINSGTVYLHSHKAFASDHEAASDMEIPDHGEESDEDRCEETTNIIYASLVKHEMPRFDLNMVVLLFEAPWSASFSVFNLYKETNPYRLNSAPSPPVTGLYARILYQSFLC